MGDAAPAARPQRPHPRGSGRDTGRHRDDRYSSIATVSDAILPTLAFSSGAVVDNSLAREVISSGPRSLFLSSLARGRQAQAERRNTRAASTRRWCSGDSRRSSLKKTCGMCVDGLSGRLVVAFPQRDARMIPAPAPPPRGRVEQRLTLPEDPERRTTPPHDRAPLAAPIDAMIARDGGRARSKRWSRWSCGDGCGPCLDCGRLSPASRCPACRRAGPYERAGWRRLCGQVIARDGARDSIRKRTHAGERAHRRYVHRNVTQRRTAEGQRNFSAARCPTSSR